mmetsp:Transcript_2078/g.3496  ORF Transcript_2078/g.3496 Transcript_2078/m.3496 type:complete len:80 (+) Transcript_2078:531-770(+)
MMSEASGNQKIAMARKMNEYSLYSHYHHHEIEGVAKCINVDGGHRRRHHIMCRIQHASSTFGVTSFQQAHKSAVQESTT